MALTRVRVKFNGVWTTLTYNSASARYEGTIRPTITSRNQPGGYFNLEAEAANSTGQTSVLSGTILPDLRLTVRETTAPVVTPVSPPQGFLTTLRPTIVMTAADEAQGSGIDTDSFSVTVDGREAASGKAVSAMEQGFRLTFTPTENLTEGPHKVVFSIADRDGNRGAASAAYTLDVTPPVLELTAPDSHRVVDVGTVMLEGTAADAISGPPVVSVSAGGVALADPEVGEGGRFSAELPLEVGVNEITVTAVNRAGLRSEERFVMIRLVTDRIEADVSRLQELYQRGEARWTAQEKEWFWNTKCRRGSYDVLDLNRVTAAMELIHEWMTFYGQAVGYISARPGAWSPQDGVTDSQGGRYIQNVEALRSAWNVPEGTPITPAALFGPAFHIQEANDIERILVAADSLRPLLERTFFQSGEIDCGED